MIDFRTLRYSVDMGETKIIWFYGTPIIVPLYFTIWQEQYLLAALTTERSGNISVDNTLKRQFKNYVEEHESLLKRQTKNKVFNYDIAVDEILLFQKMTYDKYKQKLKNLDFEGSSETFSVCGLIFKRLDGSFSAVRSLIKQGFYFETLSLIRQMLEQLSFAYSVFHKTTYNEFESPTNVNLLKTFWPLAGKLYGELSSKAHIDKTQIKKYFVLDKEEKGLVLVRSLEYSLETSLDLILILDLYCCVFEYVFSDKLTDFEFLTKSLKLKKVRPTRTFLRNWKTKFNKIDFED
ncbi:hypothetical protein [Flavobacterium wongokense]|uniref:hypothetical protein n=1 Tax=Flavobacterium wongokense TaxID=2910674 RepID=UPI001F3E3151|nr:hypothetical protein [Flavobacterium sp. WG47]MCF6133548.1 hypothetical protein [Flavobacterium sp. WG47]